jgi:hypothetical protein
MGRLEKSVALVTAGPYKLALTFVVAVAQLVEPRIVIPVVAGSSPVGHPNFISTVESFSSVQGQLTKHDVYGKVIDNFGKLVLVFVPSPNSP